MVRKKRLLTIYLVLSVLRFLQFLFFFQKIPPQILGRLPRNSGDQFTSTSDSSSTYLLLTAAIKIIFAAVCFFLVLLSAAASRIILIGMTYFLRPKESDWIARSFETTSHLSRPIAAVLARADVAIDVKWVWAILIIIITPYFFNFCSAAWTVIFKSTGKLKLGVLVLVGLRNFIILNLISFYKVICLSILSCLLQPTRILKKLL